MESINALITTARIMNTAINCWHLSGPPEPTFDSNLFELPVVVQISNLRPMIH